MKILQRTYLKEFFRLLLVTGLGLSLIFSIVELIGKISDFLPGRPSLISLMLYSLYNLPKYFIYLLPMSVFICILFTFSQAARRNELVAVKAAGGRMKDLFLPFLTAGVLIACTAFVVGELIAPVLSLKASELRSILEGKKKRSEFSDGAFWIRDRRGNPVRMDFYMQDEKRAYGLNIYITDFEFLDRTIRGESARWDGTKWIIENATLYDGNTGKITKHKELEYPEIESPDIFSGDIRTAEDMGIFELYRYIKRLKAAGFNNIKLLVDLNSKISFPLINIFLMFLGLALSLRSRIGGGLFTAGMGLAIALTYWFGYTFSLSIGYTGILPPFIAAWIVPIVFGASAVHMYIRLPE